MFELSKSLLFMFPPPNKKFSPAKFPIPPNQWENPAHTLTLLGKPCPVACIFNPSSPDPGRREKINLNFYFHISLWCLKRFYEGLHKPF